MLKLVRAFLLFLVFFILGAKVNRYFYKQWFVENFPDIFVTELKRKGYSIYRKEHVI